MDNSNITFLSFEEALATAKNEPDSEFIGLRYAAPFTRLDLYAIRADPEEAGEVNVLYEGSDLFDLGGEEDFYLPDEVPHEAKALFYARSSDLADGNAQVFGMVAEHILQQVLPGLSPDDKYRSQDDFIRAASSAFLAFWRQS